MADNIGGIISISLHIVSEIITLSEEAKFNKYRCSELAKRCKAIINYIQIVKPTSNLPSTEGLIDTLKECKEFLIKMNTSGLPIRFITSAVVNKKYMFLKENLQYWKNEFEKEFKEFKEIKEITKEDIIKDEEHYNESIFNMNKRLSKIEELIHKEFIDTKDFDKTFIDTSLVQKDENMINTFAFGVIYYGMYNKSKVLIRELNIEITGETLNTIKKGILLNSYLKDCSYVLKIYGMCTPSNSWIITESTAFGSLHDLFRYKISNKDKISITRKIIAGITYIHECDIIHKDIRSHNIMIDTGFEPKITGFEMSRENTSATAILLEADPFVQKWWSPERLAGKGSSKASDIYSFGLLMCEISISAILDNKDKIIKDEYTNISKDYSSIIKECLDNNILKRPTARELTNKLIKLETEFLIGDI